MSSTVFDSTYFIFTSAAWIITATNGSLSAASSILIMSIILRSSPESRSSAYHIIMFFMSFWDAISSIGMALNTIPMPRDVYEIYPFAGKALGTVGTCEVQGFVITMGYVLVFGSNTTLNLFYVCTFRYRMAEDKFKKYIMPVILVIYLTLSIALPTYVLRMDLFNPSPYGDYCTALASYPSDCNDLDLLDNDKVMAEEGQEEITNIGCIRGGKDTSSHHDILSLFVYIFIGGTFIVLVASLVFVVMAVFDAELRIRRTRRSRRTAPRLRRGRVREIEHFKRTRAVLIQALMYIGAFLLTWSWSIISNTGASNNFIAFFKTFFLPLQGFLNAIIFMYQKVHTLRRTNIILTTYEAFKQVIISPSTVPQVIVSGIEIATEDIGTRRRGQDLHRYPGSLTTEQRHEIARNSGLRRFGYENHNTPPASISSGVGSSSFGGITLQDVISIRGSHGCNNNNSNNNNGDDNTIDGFDGELLRSSSSSRPPPSLLQDEENPSLSSFSIENSLRDSV